MVCLFVFNEQEACSDVPNAHNHGWLESSREEAAGLCAVPPPAHSNVEMHLRGAKDFQISNKVRNSDSYQKIFLFLILKTNKNTLLNQTGDSRARHQVRICLHMPQLRRGVSTRQNTVFSRQRKWKSCGNSQKQPENSWTM